MVHLLRCISIDNHPLHIVYFRAGVLWGYPDLLEKLYGEVRSAVTEERNKGVKREKEKQQETTADDFNNVLDVMEENEDDTASAPHPDQFSPPVPLDDGSVPLDVTQTDVQPDSGTRPIDYLPTSNVRLSTPATATTEALEPTSGCPFPQPDTGEADTSPDEIEEVPGPSIPGVNDEELRVAQSKEE